MGAVNGSVQQVACGAISNIDTWALLEMDDKCLQMYTLNSRDEVCYSWEDHVIIT